MMVEIRQEARYRNAKIEIELEIKVELAKESS